MPEEMVRIEGLVRFLTSIQRRVKHVKGSSSIDFGGRERHVLFNPILTLLVTLEQKSFYPTSSD